MLVVTLLDGCLLTGCYMHATGTANAHVADALRVERGLYPVKVQPIDQASHKMDLQCKGDTLLTTSAATACQQCHIARARHSAANCNDAYGSQSRVPAKRPTGSGATPK